MKDRKNVRFASTQSNDISSDQDLCIELLFEYETALLGGHVAIAPEVYLERCPKSERKRMITGLNLATLFFAGTKERTKTIEKRLESGELQAAKKKCYEMIISKR